MSKTYYGDVSPAEFRSDQAKNTGAVTGSPKPARRSDKTELRAWQQAVARQVRRQIDDLKLKAIPENQACDFKIAFYIENRQHLPDTDNLLKGFLDPLQHGYGKGGKAHKGAGLLSDDRNIMGIYVRREVISEARATGKTTRRIVTLRCERNIKGVRFSKDIIGEKEVIGEKKQEGVRFKYLITPTFEITNVEETAPSDYVSYWKSPMQLVTAREIIGGQPSGKVSCFIDNVPGKVFDREWLHNEYGSVTSIPGYDWKKGEVVDGCIVSCRDNPDFSEKYGCPPERRKCEDKVFWWLNKWSRL